MTTLTWDRARGHASAYDVVIEGFNYRLDEVRAAIGLVQLRRLSAGNAARAGHHARYREALDGSAGITMPFRAFPEESSSHHLAVVLLPEGVDRARVQDRLREERIQTSVHYPPIHRFTAYRDGGATRRLPRTDNVAERILSLPLFPHMTKDQVDLVVDKLLAAV